MSRALLLHISVARDAAECCLLLECKAESMYALRTGLTGNREICKALNMKCREETREDDENPIAIAPCSHYDVIKLV